MPPILIECEKMLRRFVDAMPPCASVLKVRPLLLRLCARTSSMV